MAIGRWLDFGDVKTTTLALTAAGENFEADAAVAAGAFGVTSDQVLGGVRGPFNEVPVRCCTCTGTQGMRAKGCVAAWDDADCLATAFRTGTHLRLSS